MEFDRQERVAMTQNRCSVQCGGRRSPCIILTRGLRGTSSTYTEHRNSAIEGKYSHSHSQEGLHCPEGIWRYWQLRYRRRREACYDLAQRLLYLRLAAQLQGEGGNNAHRQLCLSPQEFLEIALRQRPNLRNGSPNEQGGFARLPFHTAEIVPCLGKDSTGG